MDKCDAWGNERNQETTELKVETYIFLWNTEIRVFRNFYNNL